MNQINKLKVTAFFKSKANIILTYSSYNNKHGICGHFFEVIDYYLILSKFFKTEILISEDINMPDLVKALSKYKPDLVKDIYDNIRFERPRIYDCPNSIIIFTDGNINITNIYNVKKIILFPCGTKDYSQLVKYNPLSPKGLLNKILFMVDYRLNYILPELSNSIDYVKKINFDALLPINKRDKDVSLYYKILYATSNCKLITKEKIQSYLDNLLADEILYVLVNEGSPLLDDPIIDNQVYYKVVPVPDLFNIMSEYIYTPIERKWDCSPRMIAECKYFGIPVIYDDDINEDYLKIDTGLMARKWDIENNFESLYLNDNDTIIETIKRILEEKL